MRKVKKDRQDLLKLLRGGIGRGKMIFIKKYIMRDEGFVVINII